MCFKLTWKNEQKLFLFITFTRQRAAIASLTSLSPDTLTELASKRKEDKERGRLRIERGEGELQLVGCVCGWLCCVFVLRFFRYCELRFVIWRALATFKWAHWLAISRRVFLFGARKAFGFRSAKLIGPQTFINYSKQIKIQLRAELSWVEFRFWPLWFIGISFGHILWVCI